MTVDFYIYSGDRNKIDKQLGTAAAAISIINFNDVNAKSPTVIVSSASVTLAYNYAAINGKYYFVKNQTYSTAGHMVINLELDVLKTYAADILELTGIVRRSQSSANTFLPDDTIKQYQYTKRQTVKIGSPIEYNSQILMQTIG